MNDRDLTDEAITLAAQELDVDPCALIAVVRVESSGAGFLEPGMPKILFEGHIFWRELKKNGIDPEKPADRHPSILYPKWTKAHYRGGRREYERLEEALAIHREAALRSASWGAFQIMGFNHAVCGFAGVEEFVAAHKRSAAGQLAAFCAFLQTNKLTFRLKSLDWAGFAKAYNGPGYEQNRYDLKLAAAYEACVKNRPSR